jgi:hypothetical protein
MAVTWKVHTPLPGDLFASFAAAVAQPRPEMTKMTSNSGDGVLGVDDAIKRGPSDESLEDSARSFLVAILVAMLRSRSCGDVRRNAETLMR